MRNVIALVFLSSLGFAQSKIPKEEVVLLKILNLARFNYHPDTVCWQKMIAGRFLVGFDGKIDSLEFSKGTPEFIQEALVRSFHERSPELANVLWQKFQEPTKFAFLVFYDMTIRCHEVHPETRLGLDPPKPSKKREPKSNLKTDFINLFQFETYWNFNEYVFISSIYTSRMVPTWDY